MAHMPTDPTPGARTEDKFCEECGRVTIHEWILYRGDKRIGEPSEWTLECRALSREDLAAGK